MIDSSAKVKLTLCVMQPQPNACRLHVVERYRRPKLCCSKKLNILLKLLVYQPPLLSACYFALKNLHW